MARRTPSASIGLKLEQDILGNLPLNLTDYPPPKDSYKLPPTQKIVIIVHDLDTRPFNTVTISGRRIHFTDSLTYELGKGIQHSNDD